MSSRLHRTPLVALVAACALMVCSVVYSMHGIDDRAHEHAHCDLCAHFAGSAGAPSHAAMPGKPALLVRPPTIPPAIVLIARPALGAHQPRAPPLLLTR